MRIRELVQLRASLAMYDQEIDRNRAVPSYQRLKTMIRTRNFRARNERIETGVLVRTQKGKNVSVEKKLECHQWKEKGTVYKREMLAASSPARLQTQNDGTNLRKEVHQRGQKSFRKETSKNLQSDLERKRYESVM